MLGFSSPSRQLPAVQYHEVPTITSVLHVTEHAGIANDQYRMPFHDVSLNHNFEDNGWKMFAVIVIFFASALQGCFPILKTVRLLRESHIRD